MTNELTQQNETLVERLAARKISSNKCLIIDISGSMKIDIEPGQSRIDVLRDIVSSITGNPTTIAFSTNAEIIDKNKIPEPYGQTNMANAFWLAKARGFHDALLLTDGKATDKESALFEVEGLKLQIMYIGSGNKPEFLDELAKKAGSFCSKENLKNPKQLKDKIQLLLNPGKEEKGAICL